MKGITTKRRKKILDLLSKENIENLAIKNLASDLQIAPKSIQDILDGKEIITEELGQRIEEQLDKIEEQYKHKDDKNYVDKLRAFRKKISPGIGKRIDVLWDEKVKNKYGEFIIGDEIQNRIDNYDKMKFFEKILAPRDFNYSLYGLDILNIPLGEQVIVIDCNDGKEYSTNIQDNQYSILTGLKPIWDKFDRRKRLKPGDIVGIALGQNNNHRIYLDFEYKERDKLDKAKIKNIERYQEEIRSIESNNNGKEKHEDAQEKTRNIEYDPEKEIEISLEKRRYASRNIYGAVRDGSFRERILNVYKDKCAICGLQMNMVEACHIISVEDDGTDEIINGIALCHNHHNAFDSGLIWINEKYSIMLNHSKIKDIEDANLTDGLDNFIKSSRIGEKIFLPDNHKFYPGSDYLTKKRNTVFVEEKK